MQSQADPTFYRSPGEAIAAPPEQLAYVAAYDPAGKAKDAMAVIDCRPVLGHPRRRWSAGASCPRPATSCTTSAGTPARARCATQGHGDHGQPLERRYLIVPGLRSSRTYVLDTKPDPRNPQVVRTIEADELAAKAGYSRPHTIHCGPGRHLHVRTWAGPTATTAPAGSPCWTTTPSTSSAPGSTTAATSTSATTAGGT